MLPAVATTDGHSGAYDQRHIGGISIHIPQLRDLVKSWSAATCARSGYIISTTGRSPDIAAPHASPTKPDSEMGVLSTHPGNRWGNCLVAP